MFYYWGNVSKLIILKVKMKNVQYRSAGLAESNLLFIKSSVSNMSD